MTPNITIPINIYPANRQYYYTEPGFAALVRGANALKKLDPEMLTPAQRDELRGGCEHAANGEITHGRVMRGGNVVWECRCEYVDCPRRAECAEIRASGTKKGEFSPVREHVNKGTSLADLGRTRRAERDNSEFNDEELSSDNSFFDDDFTDVFDDGTQTDTSANDGASPNANGTASPNANNDTDYTSSQSACSPLPAVYANGFEPAAFSQTLPQDATADARVLYHAPARGGATAAITAHRNRLRGDAVLHIDSRNIAQFCAKYNNLALLPNEKKQDACDTAFGTYRAVLIDDVETITEAQTPVVMTLLHYLLGRFWTMAALTRTAAENAKRSANNLDMNSVFTPGFFVAGDFALASSEFNNSLNEGDIIRVAKCSQDRKNMNISAAHLRAALLGNYVAEPAIETYPTTLEALLASPAKFANLAFGGKTGIICTEQGEAEAISTTLRAKNVPHTFVYEQDRVPRTIADILRGFDSESITKTEFAKLFTQQTDGGVAEAFKLFAACQAAVCRLTGEQKRSNLINLSDLSRAIEAGNFHEIQKNALTVAHADNVKGMSFVSAYIPQQTTTNDTALYRAATRSDASPLFLKKEHPENWRHTAHQNGRLTRFSGERVVAVFVHTNDVGETFALDRVKTGDKLEIRRGYGAVYEIFHGEEKVAAMREAFCDELTQAVGGQPPSAVTDVFADGVVTVCREGRFELGLSIFGMGVPQWTYYE